MLAIGDKGDLDIFSSQEQVFLDPTRLIISILECVSNISNPSDYDKA